MRKQIETEAQDVIKRLTLNGKSTPREVKTEK